MNIIDELVEKGEDQGYLTLSDIVETLPGDEDEPRPLDDVFVLMQEAGIDVYADECEAKSETDLTDELPSDRHEAPDLSRISTNDTVGLYLKEMSQVPLLETEEEVRLARAIEA